MRISRLHNILLLFLLLASGCSGFSYEPPLPGEEDPTQVFMRLKICVPASGSSRAADPAAGEEGDGRESAFARENMVSDLNLYFYNPSADGSLPEATNPFNTSNPGNVKIKKHIYISSELPDGFYHTDNSGGGQLTSVLATITVPLEDYMPDKGDCVIVIANAGALDNPGNLGALKDKICSTPWIGETVNATTRFTMATSRLDDGKNGKIDLSPKGTADDPFTAEATIERTAARIDFWFDDTNLIGSGDDAQLVYDVEGESGSKVTITHIMPVNNMTKASYIFKHVTYGFATDKILVCSDETVDDEGLPSNYVLTPNTLTSAPSLADLYGISRAEQVRENVSEIAQTKYSISEILKNGEKASYSETGLSFDKYVILSYANENTITGAEFNSDRISGLVFRAIYHPDTVYSGYTSASGASASESFTPDESDFSGGKDFWAVTILNPVSTNGDKKNYGDRKNLYFSKEDAASAYKKAHPGQNCIITKFDGGVCYFNLWLRHADPQDDNPDADFPMKYAIVRNNIYRVGVSFSGPGDPTPVVRKPNHIKSHIFVRKWNFRPQPLINI